MRRMSVRALPLLVLPAARATPWTAFLAAAGVGLAIVAVPAVFRVELTVEDLVGLLRAAAVCGALGLAFLLDDPAARTIATVPTPRPLRYAARAGVILPAAAAWWALVLTITGHGALLPLGGVTVEAAALGAVALAVGAVRLRSGDNGGIVAAPAVLVLVVAASRIPPHLALYVPPGDERWAAAHHRWAALLAAAVLVSVWAAVEPVRARSSMMTEID
ncbi:hypothetical protein FHR83_004508 [Actinoplanes campanulatus]|uniref:ABC transporter n=1 Tax=Actinoplanes campanulatus TaxID=113559 RepID=A0A7W5FFT9_9ACTN|nr:ABC transporter [Actinoplanes campanulatus]MBB3096834.1 hypothetical protein [Actinoplanes campanulatus]GGN44444.1 ABC transporter [Actinoplanes campanulatus]GID37378.1 ABC transporter [Actinoplanes campanulatus]